MYTQLFPLSSGSESSKRDTFFVKWQAETSDTEKDLKITIGHASWCDVSLSPMPAVVVPHYSHTF